MLVYDYNSSLHKFKQLHDETGGRLKELTFQYYDCFCGEPAYKLVSTATRHQNHFDVVQCARCGTLRINPYLSEASIELYYREIYGPIKRQAMTPEALFERQSKSADSIYDMLSAYVTKQSNILDYGAGAGGCMARFLTEGHTNVHMFDYDRNYMEYGLTRGIKPHADSVKYDLIILSHVLEHSNDPLKFLGMLVNMLSDGGKIYIEVPLLENNRSLLADLQLAHKFYFTGESLEYLAALLGCKKIASFRNAILITKGETDSMLLAQAGKRKSDAQLKSAWLETRLIKLRLWLRSLIS